MNTQKAIAAIALLGGMLASSHAGAVLFADTAGFGSVVGDFSSFDGFVTSGPQSLGGGITFGSDIASTLGAFAVDLVQNGAWGPGRFAGIGDLSPTPQSFDYIGSMTLTFANATYGGGAFMNLYQGDDQPVSLLVEALGAGGSVLESHTVTIDTSVLGYNEGHFVGIARGAQDVVALRISGDGIVLDDLRVAAQPIPELSTYALMAAGLGLLAMAARGRQRKA